MHFYEKPQKGLIDYKNIIIYLNEISHQYKH